MNEKKINLLSCGTVNWSIRVPPSKELCFPKQPDAHLLEFRYDGKIVAFIDANGNFEVRDKETLITILKTLPIEFQQSQEMMRQARLTDLKLKYPWLYGDKTINRKEVKT